PAIRHVADVVVVDHEEIADGRDRPPKAAVRSQRRAARVVLHEAARLQVRRHVEIQPDSAERLREMAFLEPAEIALAGKINREESRRMPRTDQQELIERSAIEPAKSPRR